MREEVSTILFVDDLEPVLRRWRRECKRAGKIALCARNSKDAVELARRKQPDVAVVNLIVNEDSGLAVIRQLRKLSREMFVVLACSSVSAEYASKGLAAGADVCLDKDFGMRELVTRAMFGITVQPFLEPRQRPRPAMSLEEVERQHIKHVLEANGGNVTYAARALGIIRQTLQRKLRRLDVNPRARPRRLVG